jgi:hypothetical protein
MPKGASGRRVAVKRSDHDLSLAGFSIGDHLHLRQRCPGLVAESIPLLAGGSAAVH